MYQDVTFSMFFDSFSEQYKNNFSYQGKQELFDYLEQYEEDTGEKIELDTVALCCEYSEYANLEELQKEYTVIKDMEELQENTIVIPIGETEGFIIQDF
jgi:hypothetical protein